MNDRTHFSDWRFEFDKAKTRDYYLKLGELCSCAMCRNFYANAGALPRELTLFLEQFGVDPAKPIEQWSMEAKKTEGIVDNHVYYAVHGTAESKDRSDIEIGAVRIMVSAPDPDDVVHCPEFSPNTDIEEPYFVLELSNLWLPWVVTESIDECYPEHSTFGQKIKALFKRTKQR
jgi:hypothetical protein